MNRNRTFLSILLALLLLVAQQSAAAHAVTHWFEPGHNQHEQPLPHEQSCDQCHAFAEFGSALTGSITLPLPHADSLPLPDGLPTTAIRSQRFTLFDSRAPPSA